LAADHVEILRAFQRLLEPSYEVVSRVTDGVGLIEEAERLQPDVIVLDLAMPGLNGMDACVRLNNASPRSKAIIVTTSNDEEIRQTALRNRASGFVLKQKAWSDLIGAIERAMIGGID
jgi:DNA-binding NarL/FixJ family response regulator